jgi:hypothetical protein
VAFLAFFRTFSFFTERSHLFEAPKALEIDCHLSEDHFGTKLCTFSSMEDFLLLLTAWLLCLS